MRINKASDKDNIPIKLCKKGGQTLINMLYSLNKIWIEEKVPTEWKTNITASIYKTRATNYNQNYKRISLFCTGHTTVTTVLNNILKKYINHITGECQAGMRMGKSIMDQIFMCKNLLEKTWEYNVEIYLILVDFQSAYDSI